MIGLSILKKIFKRIIKPNYKIGTILSCIGYIDSSYGNSVKSAEFIIQEENGNIFECFKYGFYGKMYPAGTKVAFVLAKYGLKKLEVIIELEKIVDKTKLT